MPEKILLIEDDIAFCTLIKTFLSKKGFEVFSAFSYKEAQTLLKQCPDLDLVITDVRLPDADGIDILKEVKSNNPCIQVILMTGYSEIKTAVNAIKNGAFDYIEKPFNPDVILTKIQQALSKRNVDNVSTIINNTTNTTASNTPQQNQDNDCFVKGESVRSLELHHLIDVVAPTNISVLIIGESGTGKENIAYTIHQQSKRADAPYIAVDCGAIPKELAASEFFGHIKGSFTGANTDKIGHFEAANGGTIFLDEVGNLSYEVQIQLLRALQERKVKPVGSSKEIEVDIRIIAATNEDLAKAVKDGHFREDLYHRLNEFSITSPPLRDRGADIMQFAQFFLKRANLELDKQIENFSDEVKVLFLKYPWPGNLREMKNAIKRSVLLSDGKTLTTNTLPQEIFKYVDNPNNMDANGNAFNSGDTHLYSSKNEEYLIKSALEKAKYNKTKAAALLGVDRKTLYNKLKLYGLNL